MLNFFARSGPKIEKIDSLCPGRRQARLARVGEGSIHKCYRRLIDYNQGTNANTPSILHLEQLAGGRDAIHIALSSRSLRSNV